MTTNMANFGEGYGEYEYIDIVRQYVSVPGERVIKYKEKLWQVLSSSKSRVTKVRQL